MKVAIKQLQQNNQILFPQTSAEAVLVKKGKTVITLDQALDFKIEKVNTPENSGLVAEKSGQEVTIQHSNPLIESNKTTEPLLVQYDQRGHIIGTAPVGKFRIFVNGNKALETDGSQDASMSFGDDFTIDNSNIQLKWTDINGNT